MAVTLLLGAELWANPIPAVGTLNQVNLAGGSTGMEALNGNSQAVTFAAGAQSGGFDIQLACPSLLGKIQVTVTGTADLHWQAVNGSQVIDLWSRQQNGLYDISSTYGERPSAAELSVRPIWGRFPYCPSACSERIPVHCTIASFRSTSGLPPNLRSTTDRRIFSTAIYRRI